ncbi:tyrosine-protein phosphatase 10D-like [Dendronephthya gigantea]|uniref:tyrosine-protein phosphatase 10D-like n=1 Tax=Dendronephthya gigantea TaxID=151771 RepID=UPI00106AF399|nr:tyrosine-protein phosphatase 10D-like [Dendronephthya gigantea]
MIFQDVQHMDETGGWHSTFQRLNIKAKSNAGSQKVGKSPENRNYNRYRDVVPYDHSLVRLRNSDTEYINANFVKVPSIRKEYILTQGPLSHTCKHFWEMIWEQNTYSVVMLNRVIEKNQLKCHQYWPLKGSMIAGDIKITVGDEEDHNEFIVRDLEIEHLKEGATRSIRHFHYIAWPDFGVPSSPQAFLKYLLTVQEFQSNVQGIGPPVIHCSAGIGRSGTFILIDAALSEIKEKDDMMDYDVRSKLLEMRTYRPGLIQTTEQLHFSYIAILEGANMVAPSAYSTAYWSMVQPQDEEEVDEGQTNGEHDGQPDAKKIKQEPSAAVQDENSETESESGEDEPVDIGAQHGNEVGDESSEQAEDDSDDQAGPDSHEGGDENSEESADENGDELREESKQESSRENEQLGFPEITVTGASSEAIAGELEEHVTEFKADKSDVIDQQQEQQKNGPIADTPITDDNQVASSYGDNSERQPSETIIAKRSDSHQEHSGQIDDTSPISENPSDIGSEVDIKSEVDIRSEMPSLSSVCSGQFPSDFHIYGSDDVITEGGPSREVAGHSTSVERVVGRWQSAEAEEGEDPKEPRPKRSAMRRNSLEGAKRKSVTFVPAVNGDAEAEDYAGYDEDRDTKSPSTRQKATEIRKRNLANKVDEIKKKMKDSEASSDDSFPIIGLVLCVVVVGFAWLYYHYHS